MVNNGTEPLSPSFCWNGDFNFLIFVRRETSSTVESFFNLLIELANRLDFNGMARFLVVQPVLWMRAEPLYSRTDERLKIGTATKNTVSAIWAVDWNADGLSSYLDLASSSIKIPLAFEAR